MKSMQSDRSKEQRNRQIISNLLGKLEKEKQMSRLKNAFQGLRLHTAMKFQSLYL